MGGRGSGGVRNTIKQTELPNDGQMLRSQNGVAIFHRLSDQNGKYLYLDELKTAPEAREKGEGTKLLNLVKSIADKEKIPVKLDAYPVGKSAMSIERLIKFYEKRGFEHTGANQMVYKSRRKR